MNAAEEMSQYLRRLRADPQEPARSAARSGGRVVGYVGHDIPVALILAAGALPVRLRSGAATPTPGADRFVESSFTPELRVIAEQWLHGRLDHLQAVVFARSDDSGQRLYYYLCELQRRGLCGGPKPLLYDVASLARDASLEHTVESTRLLAAQLGATVEMLPPALERVRQREELLRAIRERRLLPAPLPGSVAWNLEYAAACDWRNSLDPAARRWLEGAALLPMPRRVVLAGNAPPDDQLHTAIEAAGASVVLELTESTAGAGRTPRGSLAAIAEEFQRRESPALAMRRSARWLADQALDHRADGVLVWMSEQDEALPWEIARQALALRAAGIPLLQLTRQPWDISATVLTQVMQFARAPREFL